MKQILQCTVAVYIKESKEHLVKLQCISREAKSTDYSYSVHQGRQRTPCKVSMYIKENKEHSVQLQHIYHTGKCIHGFGGIYAFCRFFIDRKW